MTEDVFKIICQILREKYEYGGLDIVDFMMEYEKKSGEHLQDDWFLKYN